MKKIDTYVVLVTEMMTVIGNICTDSPAARKEVLKFDIFFILSHSLCLYNIFIIDPYVIEIAAWCLQALTYNFDVSHLQKFEQNQLFHKVVQMMLFNPNWDIIANALGILDNLSNVHYEESPDLFI